MNKIKVGQSVWEISIRKVQSEGNFSWDKSGIEIKESKVLGVSDQYIVLNDVVFTKFNNRKAGDRKRSHETYVDDIKVRITTGRDILYSPGVRIKMYSSKKPSQRLLNKMASAAANEISSKYGWLMTSTSMEIFDMVEKFNI